MVPGGRAFLVSGRCLLAVPCGRLVGPPGGRDDGRALRAGPRHRRPRPVPHRPRTPRGDRLVGPRTTPRTSGTDRRAARGAMLPRAGPPDDRGVRGRGRRRRRVGDAPRDRHRRTAIGARCLVFFAGAALLLAASSYRHVAARALLRCAGLGCWALACQPFSGRIREPPVLGWVSIALAALLVVVAVATGRGGDPPGGPVGPRSPSLCGAAALASVFVASGLFQRVWEGSPGGPFSGESTLDV